AVAGVVCHRRGARSVGRGPVVRGVVPSRGSAHRCPCGGVRVGASGTASVGACKGGGPVPRGRGCTPAHRSRGGALSWVWRSPRGLAGGCLHLVWLVH